MGVTIKSKNNSIDMGYGSFHRLRTKVAELADKKLWEHYKELDNAPLFSGRDEFFAEYDRKTEDFYKKNIKLRPVINFIYSSDCKGILTPAKCKKIYEVVKDYNDDILYGYAGRDDCAMFKDFKEILKDCMDNNCKMTWC